MRIAIVAVAACALASAACASGHVNREYARLASRGAPLVHPYSPARASIAGLVPWAAPAYLDDGLGIAGVFTFPYYIFAAGPTATRRNREATVAYYECGPGRGIYAGACPPPATPSKARQADAAQDAPPRPAAPLPAPSAAR